MEGGTQESRQSAMPGAREPWSAGRPLNIHDRNIILHPRLAAPALHRDGRWAIFFS